MLGGHFSGLDDMRLATAQQQALDALLTIARPGSVVALSAEHGAGRSTILRAAAQRLGGTILGSSDLQRALGQAGQHPLAVEESFHRLVVSALDEHKVVYLDDFHLLASMCFSCHAYPRSQLLYSTLHSLGELVAEGGRTLVVGTNENASMYWRAPGGSVTVSELTAMDYRDVCSAYLPAETLMRMDFQRVHRLARSVSARMLRQTCEALRDVADLEADGLVDYLRTHFLVSNVDLGEVQAVELRELRGLEELVETLEANIILPLENAELSSRLSLKPKRGVLIAGPPGTGKTTVGRALAHRLKSKFFLIDGNFIAGTPHFFQQVHHIFEEAKRNAPAIVFIDDSDVIFESGEEFGLYRYLLTMLDGLESRSAGAICLMMTAMDVSALPPALVRSGRIELWLETRVPDLSARAAILRDRCVSLPEEMGHVNIDRVAEESDGLSGADLKRVVEDAKLAFAFDVARGATPIETTPYLLRAVDTVRANKERYMNAESAARVRNPRRPPMFSMMGMEMMGDSHVEHVELMTP
jgi:transitional endoplasmic reticulum ATPase